MIAKKLVAGGFFTDPQVSVFAKEYATQGVSVLGEVQKPGVYPLLGARSLFDVLVAGRRHHCQSRETGEHYASRHPADPDHRLAVERRHRVGPGATSTFSPATRSWCPRRASCTWSETYTDRAACPWTTARHDRAAGHRHGRRPEPDRSSEQGQADSQDAERSVRRFRCASRTCWPPRAPDVRLQAEDIIFVPNSAAKSATRRTLEAIIQTATGLAIYGVRALRPAGRSPGSLANPVVWKFSADDWSTNCRSPGCSIEPGSSAGTEARREQKL